jgi:thymidylate kinase
MLRVYVNLFNRLNQEIPYAVWKACHELWMAVEGKGDIDLLVDLKYQERFQEIVRDHGFVHAQFNSLNFPFIEHYYGFDKESGKICHLHVYFKMVTGESHIKSYHIPIEHEILGNRFLNSLNLYEASYSDQALIYSMRHYMKRASLMGFLFWAYEKKDYLDEYDYIRCGLDSDQDDSQSGDNGLRTAFDFHRLDMGTGLSGYRSAKDKMLSISGYRRFNAMEAAWRSLHNFGVRLFYRIFRVRKRLDNGLVLAISGVDGSGKSSMVRELHGWFGKHFDVDVLHLGKPSPTGVTLILRPLLFMYRVFKGKNRDNLDDPTDYSSAGALKKKNGFVWGVRYLALAFERYKLAHKAHELAGKGAIVICDRYPTLSPGKMDSPRIGSGGSRLVKIMKHYELQLYERLPKANSLIFLDVSMEEAIKRNRARIKKDKETDDEIAFRHKENQGIDYSADQVFFVNANRDYKSVLKSLKSITWECLLVNGKKPQKLPEDQV